MSDLSPIAQPPESGGPRSSAEGKHLLLYVHVPVHSAPDGELMIERQAANGLRLWAENFGHVTVMQPLHPKPADQATHGRVSQIPGAERMTFVPLPMAYRPDRFLAHLPSAARQIRAGIVQADYLCFSLGGLWGDWGAVASILAHRMGRNYSVWTDRVESRVVRHVARTARGRAAFRASMDWRAMAALEKRVIRNATLGLFHGRETYDAYSPFCRNPALVHDIHIRKDDHIGVDLLARKQQEADSGPLRIVYAGRATPMKGPLDWIDVLVALDKRGVDFRAAWLGDGPLLGQMQSKLAAAGLQHRVDMPGFVDDRSVVLAALREAHVMLFCHKTPESPRCLIEALISGTALVGYEGAFAADLISGHGGGRLAPMDDVAELANILAAFGEDRASLATLMGCASRDAASIHDEAVFAHRSELIRRYL